MTCKIGVRWPRCSFCSAFLLPFSPCFSLSLSLPTGPLPPSFRVDLFGRLVSFCAVLTLRACGPLSTRTHHAFCHHVMCLLDTGHILLLVRLGPSPHSRAPPGHFLLSCSVRSSSALASLTCLSHSTHFSSHASCALFCSCACALLSSSHLLLALHLAELLLSLHLELAFGNFKDVRVLPHPKFWPFLGPLLRHSFDFPKCHEKPKNLQPENVKP